MAPTPERVIVTGERTTASPTESGTSVTILDRAELERAPALRLDDILRDAVPGFGLFRRSSSRVANPTTQGVSLRNIGPNGAGRALVLLDGIPQNDPFGGWVYWSRLPAAAIERVEVTQGGGAGLFGNAALGGTIALFSRSLRRDALLAEGSGGSAGTYEFSLAGQKSFPVPNADRGAGLAVFGRVDRFSTDGYPTVRGDRRGPVDIDASSEAELAEGGLQWNLDANTALTLKASGFREDRGNGTPGTNNATRAADFSAALLGSLPGPSGVEYQVQLYGQLRDFRSTFTAVDAARATETPSLDQFSVPAQAAGGSATVSLPIFGGAHRLLAGVDARWVEGETRERFRFVAGEFTRGREAGGRQIFTGIFAEDTWRPAAGTAVTLAGRLDRYANENGRRVETDLFATGSAPATLRDDRFPDRDGWVANGRLGVTQALWQETVRLRGALYTGFRVPTLNELYRPFRVRNDITEANPALKPERLYGAELGLEVQPLRTVRLSLGGFYNELHDAVANVTVAQGPATVAPFGFIPAGGTGRLRENLGRTRIAGLETAATWTPGPEWQFTASYLFSRGTVEAAAVQPALEGRRLAQSPAHQAVGSVRWTPAFLPGLQFVMQARVVGEQFEDDLNTLRLAAFATVDAAITYEFAARWQARVAVENVFDTEVQTGRSADGVVSIGAPRLVSAGLRWSY